MKQEYASLRQIQEWAWDILLSREPDFIIRPDGHTEYLRRWWIVPRNEFCNVYLHEILRSDDDRAPHDHPWSNRSFIIDGEMIEHSYYRYHRTKSRRLVPGDVVSRAPIEAHRLEISKGGRCVTLFTTGPKVREWGFYCPNGWIPWQEFTGGESGELIGRGCG